MPATYSDMTVLGSNAAFQDRVRAALLAGAIIVSNEGWNVPFHRERATYVSQILNQPDMFVPLFTSTVATDPAVIADATQGGTVPLTGANIQTQQGLVTDQHILAALSNQFNSYFRAPG